MVLFSDKLIGDLKHDSSLFFHGYTYSGNPIAAAAGIGTLDTYSEENLLSRGSMFTDLKVAALWWNGPDWLAMSSDTGKRIQTSYAEKLNIKILFQTKSIYKFLKKGKNQYFHTQ